VIPTTDFTPNTKIKKLSADKPICSLDVSTNQMYFDDTISDSNFAQSKRQIAQGLRNGGGMAIIQ